MDEKICIKIVYLILKRALVKPQTQSSYRSRDRSAITRPLGAFIVDKGTGHGTRPALRQLTVVTKKDFRFLEDAYK